MRLAGSAADPELKASSEPAAIPRRAGDPSLIEHVVYIVKENRTYDQVLGDISKGKDRKSTRLNSSHDQISYAVFCLKKKKHRFTTPIVKNAPPHKRRPATRMSVLYSSPSPPSRRYLTRLIAFDLKRCLQCQ